MTFLWREAIRRHTLVEIMKSMETLCEKVQPSHQMLITIYTDSDSPLISVEEQGLEGYSCKPLFRDNPGPCRVLRIRNLPDTNRGLIVRELLFLRLGCDTPSINLLKYRTMKVRQDQLVDFLNRNSWLMTPLKCALSGYLSD